VHPFAESLELRDLTAGTTVYKVDVRNNPGATGIVDIGAYAGSDGIPVFRDHDYELVSVYDNTSGIDQDAMAVMHLYLLDKGFTPPDLAAD
jgi:hypothetical protein